MDYPRRARASSLSISKLPRKLKLTSAQVTRLHPLHTTIMSSSRPSSIKNSKSPPLRQAAKSPRSPPAPHFDDPPHEDPPDPGPHPDVYTEDENDVPYPEPSSEQTLLPPPNFKPFFSVIEDATSGEHYHPYVHYVFADDDPVLVTAAAMRSLGLDETQYLPQNTPDREEERDPQEGSDRGNDSDQQLESPLPPPIPGVKERYLIVDIAADGHSVVDAQSLSSEWQVTDANVRFAPSFDEESSDQAYMLRVEGVEMPSKSKSKTAGEPGESKLKEAIEKAQGDPFNAMDSLVQSVESGLEIAGKIMGKERTAAEEDDNPTEAATEYVKGKGKAVETCDC